MRRILLIGYFGYGNLGDEALLRVAVDELRSACPAEDLSQWVTVVSADPQGTREALEVGAVPRSPLSGVLRAISGSDVIVIGPGGIFQDATSVRSVMYYSGLAEWARRHAKPVYLVGHGLGPLRTPLGRWAAGRAIRGSVALSVRDGESAELARRLAPGARIIEAADPALLLEPDAKAAAACCPEVAAARDAGERVCAVSLRPWPGAPLDDAFWVAILDGVRAELGCRILLLPLGGETDRRLLLSVQRLLGGDAWLCEGPPAPRTALGVLALCDFTLSMRLHGLILGAMGGARVAGIVYDPKVASFLAQIGVEPALTVGGRPWDPSEAVTAVVRSLMEQDPAATAARVVHLKARAAQGVELLREACAPSR